MHIETFLYMWLGMSWHNMDGWEVEHFNWSNKMSSQRSRAMQLLPATSNGQTPASFTLTASPACVLCLTYISRAIACILLTHGRRYDGSQSSSSCHSLQMSPDRLLEEQAADSSDSLKLDRDRNVRVTVPGSIHATRRLPCICHFARKEGRFTTHSAYIEEAPRPRHGRAQTGAPRPLSPSTAPVHTRGS